MKTFFAFIALLSTLNSTRAVGFVSFANTSSTLISVNGAPMPPQSEREFIFAVFLASSNTVFNSGQTVSFNDPTFQLAGAYNTNHHTVAGRLNLRLDVDAGSIGGYSPGERVDFVVRGWSSNMGSTWSEALANWNSGNPLVSNWAIGSSSVGNDLMLGGAAYPNSFLFGSASYQVGGFNLIPEPSAAALIGLGALTVLIRRRRG